MKQRPTDQSQMYLLTDPRRAARRGASNAVLDDIAHVAVRAMGVDAAVIVANGSLPFYEGRRTGVAGAASSELVDLAALVDPVAADEAGYAFYAATPVRDSAGARIGTLAVLAHEQRSVSEEDLVTIRKIAAIVEQSL